MSKNFELLQRAAKDDIFRFPADPDPLPQKSLFAVPRAEEPPNPEIEKLVRKLFSQNRFGGGPKVVSFSGMVRDDRSSWICARAGEALATQADASVCVVETNFCSPQLHIHLAAANSHGFAEALISKSSIRTFAAPLRKANLWLIPSGLTKPATCAPLERYRERFAELREAFGHVLVSAPALSREAEATFLGQLADGVVLIVEANRSRREAVRRAKEQLETAQVRILGAVLDQRTFPIPEKLYRWL
jgi:Mrp family chromosome partitioning ATPase